MYEYDEPAAAEEDDVDIMWPSAQAQPSKDEMEQPITVTKVTKRTKSGY